MEEKTGSDGYRARRLRHKFKSWGYAPLLHWWEDLTPTPRDFLDEQVPLQPGEIRIVAYFADHYNWLLISSRGVFWPSADIKCLSYSDIKTVGCSNGPAYAATRKNFDQPDIYVETKSSKQLTRLVSPWLFLADVTGIRHEILLDADVVEIVWNLILHMLRIERAYPR